MKSKRLWLALGLVACAWPVAVRGHETDQYSVPVGREFADLRLFFSQKVYNALCHVRDKVNSRIERTLRDGKPTAATERHYRPESMAYALLLEFPPVVFHTETLELELRSPRVVERYPGLLTAYRPVFWIYHHPALLLDITKPGRLVRTSTIMIDGTYLGTDKIIHFVHMGYLYHSAYRTKRRAGADEAEAVAQAVATGAGMNPFLSENSILGLLSTGIRSNADLVANYAGFKLYRNLTEEVRIGDDLRPALLVRDGPYWRLNEHVSPYSDFFTVFITDHWDEALNPNVYAPGIAACVGDGIRARCDDVIEWYRDERGERRSRRDFEEERVRLSTFFGEPYGYEAPDMTATLAGCCFDATSNDDPSDGGVEPELDRLGRTPLWWAADRGDIDDVRRWLDGAADVNAADADGETPLYAAVRSGDAAVVELLLQHGANPNAAGPYGQRPIHVAARSFRTELVELLLSHGADAGLRDDFGCAPLHDAAARNDAEFVGALLRKQADPNVADLHGSTPLHVAARQGNVETVELLLAYGARADEPDQFGRTARDEVNGRHRERIVAMLKAVAPGPSDAWPAGTSSMRAITEVGAEP